VSDVPGAGASRAAERVARDSYGRLVAILAAQDRDIAAAEDALSDAFAAALRVWPAQGVPANPEGWLVTVARNSGRNAKRGSGVRQRAEPEILRRLAARAGDSAEVSDAGAETYRRLRDAFEPIEPATEGGSLRLTPSCDAAARIAFRLAALANARAPA